MKPNSATAAECDAAVRARVGPWASAGLADLGRFEQDTNFVVRAAAGSGKTTALVARMVALVRCGVDVRSMVAITFTRKAAGEMNQRLYRELERARAALTGGPAEERERVRQALRDLPYSFIGTVHAFCARLLREYPMAASLPPDFATGIEEREEEKLREKALDEYLQAIHAEGSERLVCIEEMGVDLGRLPVFFSMLCQYSDLTPYTDGPEEAPHLDAAVREATALLKKWQARRPDPLLNGRDPVMKMFDRADATLAYQPPETTAERARFLKPFAASVKSNGEAKVTLKCWGARGSDAYEAVRALRDEELPALVEATIQPLLRQWSARVHREVVRLLRPAVEHYRLLRRDRGDLTHHDLLYLTRDLLRDHPDIRAKIQERFPRLLVDEFQDTDPLQAEILFYLAGSDPHEQDWRACTPRPGSLFIVGDDKQSIYRFRRADKAVFDEVAGLVEKSGGEVVALTRNFRSLGTICRWCNDTFEALFSEPETADVQAGHVPFQAHRPIGADPHGIRHIAIGKKYRNDGTAIAEEDAERIACFIRSAKDGACEGFAGAEGGEGAVFQGAARYADFLILTHRKKRLAVYADALARHGIPYTVTGSEDLGTSPELRALVELLTCALRPDDPVACVAYLKGGLCGLSDDDLYRYRRAGGCFDRMHEGAAAGVVARLDGPLGERVCRALGRVQEARALLTSTRPGVAIEQIVSESGLLAGAAHPEAAAAGSLRAGQVLRALTHVRHLIGQGLHWAEITRELRRVVRGEEAVDGMTLETGSGDAVRLMNVHQAKGLQAPVVFLADPYDPKAGPREPTVHVRRAMGEVVLPVVEGEGHYAKATHAPLGWHDASGEAFRAEEARHQAAEAHRLLYVAATRAENLLIVSTYPEKPDKGYWAPLYAHLERADVPPLEVPTIDAAPPASAPAPALDAMAEQRRDCIERLGRPTYEAHAVTDDEGRSTAFSREGYGKAFGDALHGLFEQMVRHRRQIEGLASVPITGLLRKVDAGLSPEAHERCREMAGALLRSDLWQRVRSAGTVYAGYPIVHVDGECVPRLARGTIDLLYRDASGWHVIGFKSDRIDDANDLRPLPEAHPYARQVRQYAQVWERLSSEPVAGAGLWFADAAMCIPVAV